MIFALAGGVAQAVFVLMVASIVAIIFSSAPSTAKTSAVQKESRRPALRTRARAMKREPIAGASRQILNSTLKTSLFGAASVRAA